MNRQTPTLPPESYTMSSVAEKSCNAGDNKFWEVDKWNCLPLRDIQMLPELLDVSNQVPGGVVLQTGVRGALARASLQNKHEARSATRIPSLGGTAVREDSVGSD